MPAKLGSTFVVKVLVGPVDGQDDVLLLKGLHMLFQGCRLLAGHAGRRVRGLQEGLHI